MNPLRWFALRVAVFLHASQQFVDKLTQIVRGLWRHPHVALMAVAILGYLAAAIDFQTTVIFLLAAIYGAVIQGATQ